MKITEFLAIYAACLSTLVFLWNISKSSPKFKVDLMHAIKDVENESAYGLSIIIRNHSAHKIHIAGVDLLYQYEKPSFFNKLLHLFKYRNSPKTVGWVHCSPSLLGVEENFPIEIEAFKSHDVFIPEKAIEELLAKSISRNVKVKVHDQLWNNKISKCLHVEVLK